MIVHTKMPYEVPYEVPNDVIMYHEKSIEWNILISYHVSTVGRMDHETSLQYTIDLYTHKWGSLTT